MTAPIDQHLTELYATEIPRLVGTLRRRFPSLGHQRAEEAAHEAFLQALADPALNVLCAAAHEDSGMSGLRRLVYRVAIRAHRGQWRKKAYQLEQGISEGREPVASCDPEDEVGIALGLARVDALVDRLAGPVAWSISEQHADSISSALCEFIRVPGALQGAVARRHGVPREYLNRAWNRLLRLVGLVEGHAGVEPALATQIARAASATGAGERPALTFALWELIREPTAGPVALAARHDIPPTHLRRAWSRLLQAA